MLDNDFSEDAKAFFRPKLQEAREDFSGVEVNYNAVFLNHELEDNPFKLVDIDCDQIQHWQDLAQNEATQAVKNKVNNLQQSNQFADDWNIQTLNGANGTIVNMDYFSVKVNTLPTNPNTGQQYSAHGLMEHIRKNLTALVTGSTFDPYCVTTQTMCQQETTLWNSTDPTLAIIYIDIPIDDGIVICSQYDQNDWYFKTLEGPIAGNHPVSGTRKFGFTQNNDGSYTFYTRGVDRFDSNTEENAAYISQFGHPFQPADNLWKSLQDGIKQYVTDHGGFANKGTPVHYRPDWEKVQDVLDGEKPISSLGCN